MVLGNFFSRLFQPAGVAAKRAKEPPSSLPLTHLAAEPDSRALQSSRRDLLRVAIRDVKAHLGIPADWLQMNALAGASPRRGPGLYASLVVRHWNPLLMVQAPNIERMLVQRVVLIDPAALDWLIGVSWKFELDPQVDTGVLPPSSAWGELPAGTSLPTHEMGIIAGPVLIPRSAHSPLDRLGAELRAGDGRRYTTGMEPTEPARLS